MTSHERAIIEHADDLITRYGPRGALEQARAEIASPKSGADGKLNDRGAYWHDVAQVLKAR